MFVPAPILLFVYNRPDHARATLQALARNRLATQSNLIIFSDAAGNEAAEPAVRATREVIANVSGFASVRIVNREANLGLAKSIISGVTEVIDQCGSVIVLEDDLITSPHFLQFMNDALRSYEADPKAFSIGGYQFPERTMTVPPDYPYETFASYRCCSWGWATWRDRWATIDWSMAYFDRFMADPEQREKLNRGGADLADMLALQHRGEIDSWAIRFCHAHSVADMRCVCPVRSLVENIGFDDSGVHCGANPRLQHGVLDQDFVPRRFSPADFEDARITKSFRAVFDPPPIPSLPRRVLHRARRGAAKFYHAVESAISGKS